MEWLARRLAAMGPAEVAWRTGRLSQGLVAPLIEPAAARRGLPAPDDDETWRGWWEAFRRAEDRPVLLDRERAERIAAEHPDEVSDLVEAAEHVLEGRFQFFGHPPVTLSHPVDWHHDPLPGHRLAASQSPPDRPPHRARPTRSGSGSSTGCSTCPGWHRPGCSPGARSSPSCAFEHLDSWLDQNPVGVGIAWRGAFEAGVRAISVLVAVQGLRDVAGV